MNDTLMAILIVAGIVGIYILSYFLNSKTKAPSDVVPISSCGSCTNGACSLAQKAKVQNEESEACDLYQK